MPAYHLSSIDKLLECPIDGAHGFQETYTSYQQQYRLCVVLGLQALCYCKAFCIIPDTCFSRRPAPLVAASYTHLRCSAWHQSLVAQLWTHGQARPQAYVNNGHIPDCMTCSNSRFAKPAIASRIPRIRASRSMRRSSSTEEPDA